MSTLPSVSRLSRFAYRAASSPRIDFQTMEFACAHFDCRTEDIAGLKDLRIFAFCALVLLASSTWNGCRVSWMNSGYYRVWTRLLAWFQQAKMIYLGVRRHAFQCDALSTIPQNNSGFPTKYPQLKSPRLVAMVSSKGKPTDPSLREEAKEGLLFAQNMCHNVLLS